MAPSASRRPTEGPDDSRHSGSDLPRRDFLLRASATLALLAGGLSAPARAVKNSLKPAATASPVVQARRRVARSALRAALERLGGRRAFECSGAHALVKPNLARLGRPFARACKLEALGDIVARVFEAGAARVSIVERLTIGRELFLHLSAPDMPPCLGDDRVEWVCAAEDDFVPLDVRAVRARREQDKTSGADELEASLGALRIHRAVLDCDLVVNLAFATSHPTRGVSLAFSNLLGLAGGSAVSPDWDKREVELAAMAALVRPELNVVCDLAGPEKTVTAGRDIVAVEVIAAPSEGQSDGSLPYVDLAAAWGAGSTEHLSRRIVEA